MIWLLDNDNTVPIFSGPIIAGSICLATNTLMTPHSRVRRRVVDCKCDLKRYSLKKLFRSPSDADASIAGSVERNCTITDRRYLVNVNMQRLRHTLSHYLIKSILSSLRK